MTLPQLKALSLTGLRCSGQDLARFLQPLTDLQALNFENMDITGTISFADTLRSLLPAHNQLMKFRCNQIAQNTYRLFFKTLGCLEASDFHPREGEEFFGDFLDVSGPFKYQADAAEWEGVQEKIELLTADIVVSHLDYHSEFDFGPYIWFR